MWSWKLAAPLYGEKGGGAKKISLFSPGGKEGGKNRKEKKRKKR